MKLLPTYPAYRPPGVGWLGDVPEHWEVRRLKDVGRLVAGIAFPEALQGVEGEELPFFKVGDLAKSTDGRRLDGTEHTISRETASEIRARVIPPESVVYAKIGAALLLNRRRLTTRPACIDNNMSAYVPDRARITTQWALYVLSLLDFGEHVNPGAVPSLSEGDQATLPIPLPPLDEQRAIAAYLDRETERIDALVAKKRQLIERLQEYRTALITRTVTRGLPADAARAAGLDPSSRLKPSGVEWLGDVPEHWELTAFSREVEIAEGQVDPELEPYASMLLIAPNHVESRTGRLLDYETATEQGAISGKYFCRSGDVIYSKIRPALAKVAVAPEDCLCSADMYPLRPRGLLEGTYLYWLLLSDRFVAWSVLEADRVAMPKINRETLGDLRLPIPPRLEQVAIGTYLQREVKQIHGLIGKAEAAMGRLQEYRTALIAAAITGKVDVREPAATSGPTE